MTLVTCHDCGHAGSCLIALLTGVACQLPCQSDFLYLARRSYLHDDPSISKLNPSPEFMSKAQLQKLLRLEDCKRNLSKSPRVTRMKWMGADGLGGGIEAAETDQQRRARMMMSAQMQSAASAASCASARATDGGQGGGGKGL